MDFIKNFINNGDVNSLTHGKMVMTFEFIPDVQVTSEEKKGKKENTIQEKISDTNIIEDILPYIPVKSINSTVLSQPKKPKFYKITKKQDEVLNQPHQLYIIDKKGDEVLKQKLQQEQDYKDITYKVLINEQPKRKYQEFQEYEQNTRPLKQLRVNQIIYCYICHSYHESHNYCGHATPCGLCIKFNIDNNPKHNSYFHTASQCKHICTNKYCRKKFHENSTDFHDKKFHLY